MPMPTTPLNIAPYYSNDRSMRRQQQWAGTAPQPSPSGPLLDINASGANAREPEPTLQQDPTARMANWSAQNNDTFAKLWSQPSSDELLAGMGQDGPANRDHHMDQKFAGDQRLPNDHPMSGSSLDVSNIGTAHDASSGAGLIQRTIADNLAIQMLQTRQALEQTLKIGTIVPQAIADRNEAESFMKYGNQQILPQTAVAGPPAPGRNR